MVCVWGWPRVYAPRHDPLRCPCQRRRLCVRRHGGGQRLGPSTEFLLSPAVHLTVARLSPAAGFVFAGMAVVSFLVILPASRVSDRLGRKWTIVPSAVAMASALLLMAAAGSLHLESSPCALKDWSTGLGSAEGLASALLLMPAAGAARLRNTRCC